MGECPVHCCKRFSVGVTDYDVERLQAASGLDPRQFLETVDGELLTVPMAQPYLLARREGQCVLLLDDLRCGQHPGRPEACRLYPHFVLFFDPATARPVHANTDGMRASLAALFEGREPAPYLPLLVRHLDCPGFDGPPLGEAAWQELLAEIARLQYAFGTAGWPMPAPPAAGTLPG